MNRSMKFTREEMFWSGHCKSCAAYLEHGRVKCGGLPLEEKECPRAKVGKVDFGLLVITESGAQWPGSRQPVDPKVEDGQCCLKLG